MPAAVGVALRIYSVCFFGTPVLVWEAHTSYRQTAEATPNDKTKLSESCDSELADRVQRGAHSEVRSVRSGQDIDSEREVHISGQMGVEKLWCPVLFFSYRLCLIFVFSSESFLWSGPIFCLLVRPNCQH